MDFRHTRSYLSGTPASEPFNMPGQPFPYLPEHLSRSYPSYTYIPPDTTPHQVASAQLVAAQQPPWPRPPAHNPPTQRLAAQPPAQPNAPQYIYPTVQCPCCTSRFTPFAIQYDSASTTWSTGPSNPITSPAAPPSASMPPQYPPMHTQQPAPMPSQPPAPMPIQNIDFSQYMHKVRAIYNKYSSSSSSKEYDNSFDAMSNIEKIIKTIGRQASKVSFAGKQDAINAVIDIAFEMLEEGGSTLDSEIRKGYYWATVGDAVEKILNSIPPEERLILQEDRGIYKDLCDLKEAAGAFGLDPNLDEAIGTLSSKDKAVAARLSNEEEEVDHVDDDEGGSNDDDDDGDDDDSDEESDG